MKIVITGALGHIGSRLVRELPFAMAAGKPVSDVEVVMIDNFFVQRYPSLFDLPAGPRYRFVEWDVARQDVVDLVNGADVAIHLAAITNAAGSFDQKSEVEFVNFNGTKNVAAACARLGVPLVYMSTTSVYGTAEKVVDESCSENELKPQSPYAETKLKEEKLLAAMGQSDGLNFVTCRFGTIFGVSPGMRFHTAVNKFCWQAVMGQPVTVWRTALHQMRPYLDLGDAVRAVAFILSKKLYSREIFNVVTINATVDQVLSSIKRRIPDLSVKFVDEKIMNQLSYEVSPAKFQRLGFRFEGDLNASVDATLDRLWTASSARLGPRG